MPAGLILFGPDKPKNPQNYLLFIWLRGAYRNTGLGRSAFPGDFGKTTPAWRPTRSFRLWVRLPIRDLTGPGGELQKGMWLTFFHHLDFICAGASSAKAEDEQDLQLYRDFK